jgi:hypothetical protein
MRYIKRILNFLPPHRLQKADNESGKSVKFISEKHNFVLMRLKDAIMLI